MVDNVKTLVLVKIMK